MNIGTIPARVIRVNYQETKHIIIRIPMIENTDRIAIEILVDIPS